MSTEEIDKLRQDKDDVLSVMNSLQGRRFMWRLLSECKVYHDFEGDTNQILKQVGSRRVGLFLAGLLADASDDLFFKMTLEAKNKSLEEISDVTTRQPTTSDSNYSGSGHDNGLPDFDTYVGIDTGTDSFLNSFL